MLVRIKYLLVLLIFCSGCRLIQDLQPFSSDKTPEEKKLKVGLFISGSGALTFSALPLLKLFNQEGIKFDFIAGTGWGAWLSALYAKNQSIDELKWQLFKLKEHGVFGTKWFSNKKKRVKILMDITTQMLPTMLATPFVCPALGSGNNILWLTGRYPARSVFSCLNQVPPLFFRLKKGRGYGGSLFSAGRTLKYMEQRGMDLIIWIQPDFSLKARSQVTTFSIFWQELGAHLKEQEFVRLKTKKLVVFKPKTNFSIYDFSKLDVIIKTPIASREQKSFDRIKKQLLK